MPADLRLASSADQDTLLNLMRLMQQDDPWSEPFEEATVRATLSALLQNPMYGVICLAHHAGKPVGYLVICFDYSLEYGGKGAWVDELFVAKPHRGQGIATQLLDLAEKVSPEHNAKYLHLEVSHGNPAIELYRRRGFVDHQRYLLTKRLGE